MKTNVCEWALAAALALCPLLSPAQSTGGGASSLSATGRSISVNVIGGDNPNGAWTALTSITGTDGQSGLYPVDNGNWNELAKQNTGNSGGTPETLTALKDDTGAATAATVTARLGGWWHLSATGSETVRAERQERLGWMGVGFCDPSNVADTKELSIADVPYARYSLVLYYGTNNGGNKYAAPAVTFADGSVKTYTYAADSTAESATEGTGAWGSTTSTATAGETGRYGKDVMRIDGLSGDIEIDLGTQPGAGAAPEAGSLCGFQIIDTTPPPTISVNFIGRNGPTSIKSKSGVSGIVPVNNANWNEGKSDQNANNSVTDMVVVDNQGIATSARVSYSMDGSWVAGTNPERNALLGEMGKGYCDNLKDANKDELCLRDIPYSSYSLILYFGTDKTEENIPWSPVKVTETASGKETWYSYPADYEGEAAQASDVAVGNWGTVSAKTGAFGDDVMLIEQLSGDIDIDLGARVDDGVYGSLCGFQIVCTGEIGEIIGQDESKSGVVSLNFGSNHREVPASDDLYGLAQVPGSAWQNLSGAEGNASIAVVYNTALEQLPVVNYDSATTYWTTKNDTAPFLQGYLDDGATTAPYGATVSVANVPYAAYDVIVYAGYSDSGANNIRPYEVNGTYYTWDAARGATVATTDTTATWGALDATPGYGVNALRVRGLLGGLEDLTVKGLPRNGAKRGGIAALQIVERKLITQADWGAGFADYAADTPVYILATQAVTGDVTLPADTVFDVSYYSGVGPVVDGTLTLSAGTLIRLPSGQSSVKLANTLTVSGGEAASLAFIVNGVWRTDITVDATTGTVTIPLDYKWVGSSMNDNWSNPANWSSGIVPGAEDAVEIPVDGATNIVLDTVAAVGALTISGPTATGTGAATLALSAQGDGALTVSGQMLTTGNVAVTQNANITVKGATSRVSGTGTSFDGQRGQAGFHVNQATYTVASGATLTIPATEGVSDTGELSMSNGATVTVAEGATVVADSARVTYYGGTPSGGSLNLGGTATFTQTLTLNTGNYTVNLTGGTLTTPSVSTYATGMVVSGNATLAGARTIRAIGANPSALSGAGNLTLNGTITFETPIGATYTGEITVADGASVSLGESRPKLTTVGTAQVSVTPSVEEQTQGQIVFSTSMTALPEGATFMVAGVTEQVSAIVANGELTLSWGVTPTTLATTANWSDKVWTVDGTAGQVAPTEGVVVLDGTAAPITVTLDTAVPEAITQILVQGEVNLVTTAAQPTIPASIAFAEGVTLGVGQTSGAGVPTAKFAAAWQMNESMTLDIQGPFDFANSAMLSGYNEVGGDLRISADGVSLAFLGGLRVVGSLAIAADNVTIEGLYMVLGDTLTLEGDAITLKGSGNGLTLAELTSVTSNGANNAILKVTNSCPILTVAGGSLTYGDDVSNLKGALVADGATLRLAETWKAAQTLHVAAEAGATNTATLDLSAIAAPAPEVAGEETLTHKRPTLARYDDGHYALPATVLVAPTPKEQEAGQIVIDLLNNNPGPQLSGEVKVTDETWVPLVSSTATAITLRNVPGPGIAGLSAEVEQMVREVARDALLGEAISTYRVEVRTRGKVFGAGDAETAGLLAGALACFETEPSTDIVSGADEAAESCVVFVAYDFGIAGIAANASGGLDVTVKAQSNLGDAGAEAEPLPFREGVVVEVLCGDAVVGTATAAAGNGGTLTATLATAPEGVLSVRVSEPGEAAAQAN